jgi:DNA-binding MarR family transcriptional regulator
MERDGLVTKTRENRKSVLKKFDLTEKGVIAHENCAKKNSIKKIMSVLSEEELQQLILLMKRLSSEAEKY